MFTDSEVLRRHVGSPDEIVLPEAVRVYARTISKDDVPIIPMTNTGPTKIPLIMYDYDDFKNIYF